MAAEPVGGLQASPARLASPDAYFRSFASAARIVRARRRAKAAGTSGPNLRRQFGRSWSVPGRLVAIVSPTRSSNWALARIEPAPPISAWTAAAKASSSGASSPGAAAISPAASSAAIRPRFSSRRAAIASPAAGSVRSPSVSLSAISAPPHQPASVAQIVGRDAGDRERRIVGGRQDLGALALEPQHPHPEDVGLRQPVAETLGHRAEVLADHHALGPLAFERDMADEVVERIGEIGAVGRLRAVGNEEQPLQAHRVVDAQHAGVAHVGAIERGEPRPALAGAGERVGRRQVPVLPAGSRTGRAARRPRRLARVPRVRPGLRAVGRRADGEIAVEADLEAAPARAARRRAKLTVGEPLAEQGEVERVRACARSPPRSRVASPSRKASGQSRQFAPASLAAIAWNAANRRSARRPASTKAR